MSDNLLNRTTDTFATRLATLAQWMQPRYDFGVIIDRLHASEDFCSPLARAVGSKGYHP